MFLISVRVSSGWSCSVPTANRPGSPSLTGPGHLGDWSAPPWLPGLPFQRSADRRCAPRCSGRTAHRRSTPLPVFIAQLFPIRTPRSRPSGRRWSGGTSVPGFAPTRRTESRAGVTMVLATGGRPVTSPLTVATAKVTSWTPGAGILDHLTAHVHRRVLDPAGDRFQRQLLGHLLHADPGDENAHAVGDRAPRRGNADIALQQRRTGGGQQRADVRGRKPHGADHPASSSWTVLGPTTGRAMPASGTRLCPGGRDQGGVGHRQLVQRLVDGGRGGPDLLNPDRPAISAAGGCGAAQWWRLRPPTDPRRGTARRACRRCIRSLENVGHPRLHRRHRHRGAVDVEGDGLTRRDRQSSGPDGVTRIAAVITRSAGEATAGVWSAHSSLSRPPWW